MITTRSHVEVTWTATDVNSGIINVNVYSGWTDGRGSLPGIGFNVQSSEPSEPTTIWTTLPDPLTFIGTRTGHYIDVSFTYGNQTFSTPSVASGGEKKIALFDVVPPPPGTWWYASDA